MAASPNIVLVHGAWADGSCWSDVIGRLQADGYKFTAPQLPETSLADDVARVRHVLARQSGPTVLAAHSYGGQVVTSLGTDAPNVVGLAYIAGFGLDEGESIGALLQAGSSDPGGGECRCRLGGLRLDPRGRFPRSLRRRYRPGQGEGHVRRAAASASVYVRRRDGRPRRGSHRPPGI
jgi:pimeloyl-ACP methyl ester carboxylesterase